MRVEPSWRGWEPLQKRPHRAPQPLLPREDTAKSLQQGESLHSAVLFPWTPSFQNYEKWIFVVCKLPGLWCLSWQPERTKTSTTKIMQHVSRFPLGGKVQGSPWQSTSGRGSDWKYRRLWSETQMLLFFYCSYFYLGSFISTSVPPTNLWVLWGQESWFVWVY